MNVLLSGLKGYMGQEVQKLCLQGVRGAVLTAGVDIHADGTECVPCYTSFENAPANVDCIIDFSHFSATQPLLRSSPPPATRRSKRS